jgi:2-amino-4-hydroxy-6-hydroxymethyldihydropteridine diphosphokinase
MKTVFLGLGSNLGDRKVHLRRALKLLPPKVKVEVRSPVYEAVPLYLTDQPDFLNMVIRCTTQLVPQELLRHTQKVEADMGRPGKTHNRPRVIDIDILTYGEDVVATEELIIPHPRIAERAFVLAPLRDIAPRFTHPKMKLSVSEMLSELSDWQNMVRETNIRV